MKQKRATQVLAAISAAILILSGCGGTAGEMQETMESEEETAVETTENIKADDTAAEDAQDAVEMAEEEVKENPYDALPASFTFLLSGSEDSSFYTDYRDNPAVKYWLDKEWDSDGNGTTKKLELEFMYPPTGSEQQNLNTLLATGEYPDVIDLNYSSEGPAALYAEGVALDLTELVETYMPNYMEYMETHPEYARQMRNDGKIIALYSYADVPEPPFAGWMYRRDWIVKYGTNPETGEAFTGSWNEDKTEWEDDVVFPSGSADPVYISDWEWMFEIFEKALKEQGIENEGYVFQLYYNGYLGTGSLVSGFGGIGCSEYIDRDGTVHYGFTEEGFRAYVECASTWYAKGWINQNFEENTSDLFFKVDSPVIFSGKCGLWMGGKAQLANGLAIEGDPLTEDACVYGAAEPINDVYGDASVQNIEPRVYYQTGAPYGGSVITNKAEGKDLATLLTAWDYIYSQEGGLLHNYSLSREMQAEIQDPMLNEYGLEDGGWYAKEEEDGTTTYVVNGKRESVEGLSTAIAMTRITGRKAYKNVDLGRGTVMNHGLEEMNKYEAVGQITQILKNQVDPADADTISNKTTQITTFCEQEVPNFITGRKDITDDAQWQAFVDGVNEFDPQAICDIYNKIIENL